jgi:hypothetical protein
MKKFVVKFSCFLSIFSYAHFASAQTVGQIALGWLYSPPSQRITNSETGLVSDYFYDGDRACLEEPRENRAALELARRVAEQCWVRAGQYQSYCFYQDGSHRGTFRTSTTPHGCRYMYEIRFPGTARYNW